MSEAALCYHCGQALPGGQAFSSVTIDSVAQPMCCAGCAAVAQAIVDFGQTAYYRERTAYAQTVDLEALSPKALAVYDAEPTPEEEVREASFAIDGIRCGACVWLIEQRVAALAGVLAATMNMATEKLYVRWDTRRCSTGAILRAVREIGYLAYPYDAGRHGEQLAKASRTMLKRVFIAGLAMMQVMMYAAPGYFAHDGTLDADMASLLRWASLVLTVPAMLYAAWPFFAGAWQSLATRAIGMDVPVALGIAAGLLGSVAATLQGSSEVYFDSVSMFVFFLLGARYLELGARRAAANALEKLHHGLPAAATLVGGTPEQPVQTVVPAASLVVGDRISVKLGETVAADGEIEEGATTLDLSLLTGESRPEARQRGDSVPGGAINTGAPVTVRVTRAAADSTLAALVRLAERAGQGKPRLAEKADAVARVFVALLLLLAVAAFAWWHVYHPERAWQVAVAVLVVSCPCALSLATPTALAAAADALLRRGVLLIRPAALEALEGASHIVFDKTGTLTQGKPVLEEVRVLGTRERADCLRIAAAIEAGSAHPLAQAVLQAASGLVLPAARILSESAGRGLEAEVDGVRYRLGTAAFVAELAGHPGVGQPHSGVSVAWLGCEGQMLAQLLFADPLRPEAREIVRGLRQAGKTVVLLSGDDSGLVSAVAHLLGIDEAHGRQLPEDKLAHVQRLQAEGAVVVMIGDGVNDAAVLGAANVSVAMGKGAALAQAQADAVLFGHGLSPLQDLVRTAGQAMRVMRQNLLWASVYNVSAIPAAAFGLIGPLASGIGMAASSALVVINSLRLRQTKL
ncbi:heavy metal translocating P-type ATPase [Massilia sp. TS11]|uniref:heavy metal translocating P-type ATPase n=1 Tax=Massilia sp. TS11 TaxID=2908003 RepID=UPI001EDBD1E0|nr:cadmium-translocating P-type ATPase [Massilia sp. TS11]